MKILKHIYAEVYYSDLDKPTEEIEKLENFLIKNTNIKNIFLVKVNPQSEDVFVTKYSGDKDSLVDYIFIKSDLAGVGNYNFIVECKEPLMPIKIVNIVKNHVNNKFFDNDYIEDLINKDIAESVLITDCDGSWVELFKK